LKTSITGNVAYQKHVIEPDHIIEEGAQKAKWETERTITDPAEFEAAKKARGAARYAIASVCANSAFGLLCPEASADKLDAAVAEARRITEAFNAKAKLSQVYVYVIAGRVAPDDVEAVRAINSEVRDLLQEMKDGVANLDVKAVREAANRARSIGTMLSPDAAERIQEAIAAARGAARRIVSAGEQAAEEIDQGTILTLTQARTAFLDLDESGEIGAPIAEGRALDLMPVALAIDDGKKAKKSKPQVPAFEME
jgi:hypothetical protein